MDGVGRRLKHAAADRFAAKRRRARGTLDATRARLDERACGERQPRPCSFVRFSAPLVPRTGGRRTPRFCMRKSLGPGTKWVRPIDEVERSRGRRVFALGRTASVVEPLVCRVGRRGHLALPPPRTSLTLSRTLVRPLREGLPLPKPAAFRAKGLVYLGARDYYDEVVPGGSAAVRTAIAETGDGALAAFFEQHFVASGWYDAVPVATISAFAARLCRVPHAQLIRENSAWLAARDLRGVYRVLVSLSSVAMVAMRLPALSMRYFDFGGADGKMVRESAMESHRFGIPALLAPWFIFAVEGFVPVALRMAGAKDVTVTYGPPRAEGVRDGIKLMRLRFEISWT
jgi:hypothetical protein